MEKKSSQGDNALYLYLFILSLSSEVSESEADRFIYSWNMLAPGPRAPFSPEGDMIKAAVAYTSEAGRVFIAQARNPRIIDRGKVARLSFLSS